MTDMVIKELLKFPAKLLSKGASELKKILKKLGAFFSKLISFLHKEINAMIKEIGQFFKGVKVYIEKTKVSANRIVERIEEYGYERGWWVKIIQQTVSESEIPPEILAKSTNEEKADITEDVKEELKLVS